jgi:hypothetical protein
MSTKQWAGLLVLLGLLIGHGLYDALVNPARPTDIYSPRSRLILFVPASILWGLSVGGLLYGALRKRNS